MTVHVAVRREGHVTDAASKGPFPGVDQHVAIQRTGGAEGLGADAAGVRMIGRIVLPNVDGECVLRVQLFRANGTDPLASQIILLNS